MPTSPARLFSLIRIAEAGFASSRVELRPVRPFSKVTSQLIRRKKSLISLQLMMPARPPGTGWAALESVIAVFGGVEFGEFVFSDDAVAALQGDRVDDRHFL